MSQHTIYIIGYAKNIKGQAVLEAENIGLYFIKGIERWTDDWLNHRIKVIGDLVMAESNQPRVINRAVVQLIAQDESPAKKQKLFYF